jgi:predicted dehydrogenase
MSGPVGIGVIGAGVISGQYLSNLVTFPDLAVRGVADLDPERAKARAAEFGVPAASSVEALLAQDDVDIVVNLTIPAAHVQVGEQILAAGKHVWSEKPLALDTAGAARLLDAASSAGLRVACAPDTVLGAGIQTALRLIRSGAIGEPVSATTMMLTPGPESWHPDPEFLFARGGGPLFDMGPYYLTTLATIFGGVRRVAAAASKSHETRVIGSGPRAGTRFPVEVPTHYGALLDFGGGRSAQSTFSFQSALPRQGFVEITGTEGAAVLPDPNRFDGETLLWRRGEKEPEHVAATGATTGRGTGVLELARAIAEGRPERASGALAAHVLDVMLAIDEAGASGSFVELASAVEPVAPLPEDWDPTAAVLTRG